MFHSEFSKYSKEELIGLLQKVHSQVGFLQQKIDALVRQIYGCKSEKIDPNQLEFLLKELSSGKEDAPCPEKEQGAEYPRGRKRHRKKTFPRLPENLPVEEIIIEPREVETHPDHWRCIGEEVSEQLDYNPGRFFKRRTIRRKYVLCGNKDHAPVIAPLPEKLQERCLAAPGLLTQIVINKYADHLPLYRQEQIFHRRYGVHIPRQTMVRWVEMVSTWLKPIYEEMKKELRCHGYMQVDETPVRYLDQKGIGSRQGYFWVYSRPGGDVLFDWHPSRSGDCLENILGKDFHGVIQCDGYQGYPSYAKGSDHIILAGCWAHARRKFFEAKEESPRFAGWVLNQLRHLYHIEKLLRENRAGPRLRQAMRISHSRLMVNRIFKALKKKCTAYLPQSRIGKAIAYTLNLEPMLKRFLKDGRIEIDNNLVENAIRPTALGKKNWLFIGDVRAGQRSAILYSIIESCRRRQIEPYSYLREILERLPSMTNKQVHELTPKNWQRRHRQNRKSA